MRKGIFSVEINVRAEAIKLFNETWDLIDLKERNESEKALMLLKTHTSRYLWGLVGEPVNFSRGDWQISRCYALLNMGEAALMYGESSLKPALENNFGAMDKTFGYEAVARAHALLGNKEDAAAYKKKGLEAAATIEKEGDRKYAEGELNSIEI